MDLTIERIRACHWVFSRVDWFDVIDRDLYTCMVDQREAELLGWA